MSKLKVRLVARDERRGELTAIELASVLEQLIPCEASNNKYRIFAANDNEIRIIMGDGFTFVTIYPKDRFVRINKTETDLDIVVES